MKALRRKSPNISLGDLARAVHELGLSDPPTVKLVAGMLGFHIEAAAGEAPAVAVGDAGAGGQVGRAASPTPEAEEGGEEESRSEPLIEQKVIPVELTFTKAEKEELIPEVEVTPFPPQGPDIDVTLPPLDPLFAPQWTRGILSAALATNEDEGVLDVERVAEMLANCETVERLPTVSARTMRRGMHLLLDIGQAMMPFERDQLWLAQEIRRVVGESHVEAFNFAGSPLRGAGARPRPWPQYCPPLPGTPIVLLTDLGICRLARSGERADEAEWAEFCDGMRRACCPLIALVPYKLSRWPRSLARRMTIVQWDRGTTAATVGKMFKLSAEVTWP